MEIYQVRCSPHCTSCRSCECASSCTSAAVQCSCSLTCTTAGPRLCKQDWRRCRHCVRRGERRIRNQPPGRPVSLLKLAAQTLCHMRLASCSVAAALAVREWERHHCGAHHCPTVCSTASPSQSGRALATIRTNCFPSLQVLGRRHLRSRAAQRYPRYQVWRQGALRTSGKLSCHCLVNNNKKCFFWSWE